jgi:RNA-directed DNA polymerase
MAISEAQLVSRFEELFTPDALFEVFVRRFASSPAKGCDRINGYQYEPRAKLDLQVVSTKCLAGTFRFSPYAETLRTRGRDRSPRLISVPTVRDRVVLHQLKELLALTFPNSVPKNIASSLVREVAASVAALQPKEHFACGCDVKDFYGSIRRERLNTQLARTIKEPRLLNLIARALVTPTVPPAARRRDHSKYKTSAGVPQGLAISNILAAVYMFEVDVAMKQFGIKYFRYVDDVLILGDEATVRRAHRSFLARARVRSLSVHKLDSGKSHISRLDVRFGYLGYLFEWPMVTVRSSTVENLLQSLAARFSEFRHNKAWRMTRYAYLTSERINDIFLFELNERITGAISEKRRYGWVAYFSQITDLSLLHKLDSAVRGMFGRLADFGGVPPKGLKSFARAFFEMKYRPAGGYVRNFDLLKSPAEKLKYLQERGRLDPKEALTDDQIERAFVRYRSKVLAAMQADEGNMY